MNVERRDDVRLETNWNYCMVYELFEPRFILQGGSASSDLHCYLALQTPSAVTAASTTSGLRHALRTAPAAYLPFRGIALTGPTFGSITSTTEAEMRSSVVDASIHRLYSEKVDLLAADNVDTVLDASGYASCCVCQGQDSPFEV